jgi:hypothetical protein
MTTLIIICAIVGAVCLLGTFIMGISALLDKWQGLRPILPPPDRSTMRYSERMDEMARYRARIEKQGVAE